MIPFSPRRFKAYRDDLSQAILELSLERRNTAPIHELMQDLRRVVEYGRPNQKPHLEQGFQRYSFLGEPSIETEEDLVTSISRLKDKLSKASGVAQRAVAAIEVEADSLIAREGIIKAKTASSFAPHKAILDEAHSELQAIEDALNLMSNGGPDLDPLHEPEPIAPVSTTEPQA